VSEKRVFEGLVLSGLDQNPATEYTEWSREDKYATVSADTMLADFEGKRVRVTIEVLEE